jgi:hypothetical protein
MIGNIASALPLVLAACFLMGISFQTGRLAADGAIGALWFFTFSDYVNYSVPAMLVLLTFILAGVPQYAIERVFQRKELSTETNKVVQPSPHHNQRHRASRRQVLLGRVVYIVGAAGVIGAPLLFAYLHNELTLSRGLAITTFIVGALFLAQLFARAEAQPVELLPYAMAGAFFLWAIFWCTFLGYAFHSSDQTTPGYDVTVNHRAMHPYDVLPLERGVILVSSGNYQFAPWSEVTAIAPRYYSSTASGHQLTTTTPRPAAPTANRKKPAVH